MSLTFLISPSFQTPTNAKTTLLPLLDLVKEEHKETTLIPSTPLALKMLPPVNTTAVSLEQLALQPSNATTVKYALSLASATIRY